jgi:hypothetical protein
MALPKGMSNEAEKASNIFFLLRTVLQNEGNFKLWTPFMFMALRSLETFGLLAFWFGLSFFHSTLWSDQKI